MANANKFVINYDNVRKLILQSEEVKKVGEELAQEKFGNIEESYIGVQRCWIEGKQ